MFYVERSYLCICVLKCLERKSKCKLKDGWVTYMLDSIEEKNVNSLCLLLKWNRKAFFYVFYAKIWKFKSKLVWEKFY